MSSNATIKLLSTRTHRLIVQEEVESLKEQRAVAEELLTLAISRAAEWNGQVEQALQDSNGDEGYWADQRVCLSSLPDQMTVFSLSLRIAGMSRRLDELERTEVGYVEEALRRCHGLDDLGWLFRAVVAPGDRAEFDQLRLVMHQEHRARRMRIHALGRSLGMTKTPQLERSMALAWSWACWTRQLAGGAVTAIRYADILRHIF